MARPSALHQPPADDLVLDGSPDLTAGDQTAIEAIRRQLAEEYPDAADEPAPVETGPATPVLRARSRAAWSSPLVAVLVMLSGVAGGVVGAVVAVQLLRDPEVVMPGATAASPGGIADDEKPAVMPEAAMSETASVERRAYASGRQPASVAAVRATADLPPRADRAERPRSLASGGPVPPAPP